ncbi:MAG: ATP-binding protein [Candidatus Nanopelagicales bacterium]
MPEASLCIPALPEQVRTARLVAAAAARRAGLDDEMLDEVRLAVGEAAARAVLRNVRSGTHADVRVVLADDLDTFTVEVHDAGGDLPDEDEGMALALVGALADRSDVRPGTRGDILRLVWNLPPRD